MCGITGFMAFNDGLDLKYIESMNKLIRHRGPDDEGYYIQDEFGGELILGGDDTSYSKDEYNYLPRDNINNLDNNKAKFALGHRRLSIVDLSELGHQPLSIENGNYWITYNGEVYNHIEIRKELEDMGYKFISHSDTEVILTAYMEWGEGCLHKFNGMFAFIIYDKLLHKCFIARDRFGVKPLYYYQDTKGIYFASEIKQFTVLPEWQARLNHQRAFDFLVHGLTDHTNETLFRGVYQLRGGEFACVELNRLSDSKVFNLTPSKWYQLNTTLYKHDYFMACEDFKRTFLEAVKLRLRADVDVGSCLSGGLDSSAIVSAMALELENSSNSIKTFSACSHYKEFDETRYVNIVTKHTDAVPFYCYPELDGLFSDIREITWHQDEPFGSTSIYAQWRVFELASQNKIKVMLDGQGADEQLAGYQGLYFQVMLNQLLKQFRLVRFIMELYWLKKIHGFNIYKGLLKAFLSILPTKFTSLIGKVLKKQKYLINWLNNDHLNYNNIDPFSSLDKSSLQNTGYSQIIYNNLPMLLHWEDRDSMAHSIESRVPFLDFKLVELVCSMPDEYKIKDGVTKRVLRDALDGILPEAIKDRMSKLGFVTPEQLWISENAVLFKQQLEKSIASSLGVLNKDKVLNVFDEVISGKSAFDFWLWRVINFGQWMDLFQVKL
jgi:asparagine synthase (glutamine-hydrolysing)